MSAIPRLTLKENVVMRLIGLYMVLFPNAGVAFVAECVPRINEKVAAARKRDDNGALAA